MFDAETGLSQNHYREYQGLSGRYTQSDPIGLQGGINSFSYVYNDPMSNSDPTGLSSECRVLFTLNGAWSTQLQSSVANGPGTWGLLNYNVYLTQSTRLIPFIGPAIPGLPRGGVTCHARFVKNYIDTYVRSRTIQTFEVCLETDCGKLRKHTVMRERREEELFTKSKQSFEGQKDENFSLPAAMDGLGLLRCIEWVKNLR